MDVSIVTLYTSVTPHCFWNRTFYWSIILLTFAFSENKNVFLVLLQWFKGKYLLFLVCYDIWSLRKISLGWSVEKFSFFLTLSLEILRDQHFDSLEIPKEKVPNIFFNKPEKISCGFIPRNMVFQNVRKVQENKAKNILGSYDTLIKNTIPNARKKEIFLWNMVKVPRKHFLFSEKAKVKRIIDQ